MTLPARDDPSYMTVWWRLHPRAGAAYTRKWKYGLAGTDYEQMLQDQGGVCAICGEVETRKDRMGVVREGLSVDHDHITDRVRGLLCAACNSALASARDDPRILRAMAVYLETH